MAESGSERNVVWEQEGILLESHGCGESGKEYHLGTIQVLQRKFGNFIYWLPDANISSSRQVASPVCENEWTVISPTEPVPYAAEAPVVRPIRVDIADLQCIQVGRAADEGSPSKSVRHKQGPDLGQTCRLTLTQKDGTTLPGLIFPSGSAEKFMEILNPFTNLRRSRRDDSLIICLNPNEDAYDNASTRNRQGRRHEDSVYIPLVGHLPSEKIQHGADAVWKFVSSMKKDPYSTTLTTFSKLYDLMLHDENDIQYQQRSDDELAELLQESFSFKLNGEGKDGDATKEDNIASGEDGYEVITAIKPELVQRPEVSRGESVTEMVWESFFGESGVVENVGELKKLIFRGGLEENCRREAWKYLLDYYPWKMTHDDRVELRKRLSDDYYRMKLQWKTISLDQEMRFTAYRLRKDLIEKDVNRTDRNMAYFGGDRNPNLDLLSDILMTYVMYDFDLGYVQGMSDILAPILFVMDNEVDAFWCFAKVLEQTKENFSLDQGGMKAQLAQLNQLLQVVDPHLWSYLESRESGNLFFCFRWLLVLFKREFTYPQVLKLWEVLFACRSGDDLGLPKNFHLLFALAILDSQRSMILENRFGFTEILKHVNDLALRLDLEELLTRAEAIYEQIRQSPKVSGEVRAIVGLEPVETDNLR